MSKVYVLSGLGADKRAFDQIDFTQYDVEFIEWIPLLKHEPLSKYAERISQLMTVENSFLIGLSFGGIVGVEIAKLRKVKKLILISSVKTKDEYPLIYKFTRGLKLNLLMPSRVLKTPNSFLYWLFGVQHNSEKQTLKAILRETDSTFLKWAISEILNWTNEEKPENYVHIHGDRDRIFPLQNIKVDYVIDGGGHFMIVNKAKEIEAVLRKVIME